MTTTFIYALCEPGTRMVRYIGKANDPKKRLRSHLQKSGSLKHENRLGRWLRKAGVPNLVVLREVPVKEWQKAEERYIRLARGCGMELVNATDGGEGVHNPSLESRALSRAAKLGNRNPNFGGVPAATLAAATAANTGAKRSSATCENISRALKGKSKSEAHRKALSIAQSGEKAAFFGRTHTPETLALMRAAKLGKKKSEQTKANMRAAWVVRKEKSTL